MLDANRNRLLALDLKVRLYSSTSRWSYED